MPGPTNAVRRQPAPKPAPAPTPAPSARVFDSTRNALENANANVKNYLAKGQYGRAFGATLPQVATVPLGLVNDMINKPGNALLSGLGNVVSGALGSSGSTTVNKTPTVAADAGAGAGTTIGNAAGHAVATALAAGRAAAPALSTQDELAAYIHSVLSGGATIREAQALGPLVPATIKQAQTSKDALFGQTAAMSQAIYTQQAKALNDAVAAGTITKEQGEIGAQKATDAYFQRNAGLVGFDPTKLALANQLGNQDAQGN